MASIAAAHPLAPEQRAVTGRDLGWLCGCLVFVMAPHAMRVPWWLTAFAVCLFGWRSYIAISQRRLPSVWVLLAIAVLAMVATGLEYRTIFGRSSGIALLMIFAGLKLLEMRTHRDATMVVFLCYFLVLTNFLFTQSIPTALIMFAALVAITGALVSFSAPQRRPVSNLRTAGLLLTHAIPIAAVLFVLFPRVQGPLWGMPQDAYSGVTGLTDTMSPGTLSQLSVSDATAFRALFKGRSPSPRQLYWRGPVLWDFDGRTWRTGPRRWTQADEITGGEARYEYSVVLEPHNRNWLFALETAASLPPNAWISNDGQIMSNIEIRNRMRYEMVSVAGGVRATEETRGSLARALVLPSTFNPRTTALAQEWRRTIPDHDALLRHAIGWLRDQRFVYTLLPPALGRNSVDEFLFDTKRGFCEHFASAFVVLMRSAGVPARVVTGYQGGDFNPLDGYITVRQAEAHAWAEVFIKDRWVRVDPTAVSMPGRLDAGMASSVPAGDPVPYLMRFDVAWLKSMRYNWEALTNRWNLWVLGYNTDRQREFLSRIGFTDADWRNLATMLVTAVGLIVAGLLAWSLKRLVRPDPVQQLWLKFCRKLALAGLPREPHEGPRDFTERAAQRFPQAAAAIVSVGERYIALRYGVVRHDAEMAQLKRTVQEFRPA
jgi:transglutaminase-like putative cysteine protease